MQPYLSRARGTIAQMGAMGCLKLSSSLMFCTKLANLHVASNRISIVGGGALMKGIMEGLVDASAVLFVLVCVPAERI